jgi:predicted transcriptional regulator
MATLQDNVHIIPLGHEYDRAVAPFKKHSVDRVYLLSITKNTGNYEEEMISRQVHFTNKVIEFFKSKNTEVISREVQLFDLLEVMKQISAIIKDEQEKGHNVLINMSACGRKTSIGAALAGMANGAGVYYVSAETYSLDYATFQEHGLSICEKGETFRFENFEFDLPDEVSQKILVKLYQENRGVLSTELRDFMHDIGVEGFEIKLSNISKATKVIKKPDGKSVNKRDVVIGQNIRLEKKYLGHLEASGYVKRERSGRNNIISITESGKYAACISGRM